MESLQITQADGRIDGLKTDWGRGIGESNTHIAHCTQEGRPGTCLETSSLNSSLGGVRRSSTDYRKGSLNTKRALKPLTFNLSFLQDVLGK